MDAFTSEAGEAVGKKEYADSRDRIEAGTDPGGGLPESL